MTRLPASLFTHAPCMWSNPSQRNAPEFLRARLINANYLDLVELCLVHGVDVVISSLSELTPEMDPAQYHMEASMLKNIRDGLIKRGVSDV